MPFETDNAWGHMLDIDVALVDPDEATTENFGPAVAAAAPGVVGRLIICPQPPDRC